MTLRYALSSALLIGLGLAACAAPEPETDTAAALPTLSGTESFIVQVAGTEIGAMSVDHTSGQTVIDYEFRNNGLDSKSVGKISRV